MVIVGVVCHKLTLCLFPQTTGVNQKQNPPDFGKFQQTVNRSNRSKGFACTCCHLHQGFRLGEAERMFQIGNSLDLAVTETSCIQFRKALHPVTDCGRVFKKLCQSLRTVKVEDAARTVFLISVISKAGKFPRSFVGKANGIITFNPLEFAVGITPGLGFNNGNVFSGLIRLGFYHAHRYAINEQSIIHRACICRKFTHSHAQAC